MSNCPLHTNAWACIGNPAAAIARNAASPPVIAHRAARIWDTFIGPPLRYAVKLTIVLALGRQIPRPTFPVRKHLLPPLELRCQGNLERPRPLSFPGWYAKCATTMVGRSSGPARADGHRRGTSPPLGPSSLAGIISDFPRCVRRCGDRAGGPRSHGTPLQRHPPVARSRPAVNRPVWKALIPKSGYAKGAYPRPVNAGRGQDGTRYRYRAHLRWSAPSQGAGGRPPLERVEAGVRRADDEARNPCRVPGREGRPAA